MDVTPLYGLRLRTPRLELRLPVREELESLRDVALAGIHPPELMPFAVAWTDMPALPGFIDFHEQLRRSWSPDSWHLELAVWSGDGPAGFQGLMSEGFTRNRRVGTGSWLGSRFQRRGYGTEMRTAVLELAFRGLGAEIARSGAIDGNAASLRVSEKLGYRIVGRSTVAPRGAEVGHTDLELRSEDWRPPIEVEIEGLEPCRQLFGL